MITNITDRERTQAAVILALESARDEMSARIEALTAELAEARLQFVAAFGQMEAQYPCSIIEADFNTYTVLLQMTGDYRVRSGPHLLVPLPIPTKATPIWDQLADIGASDPQAWEAKDKT